MSPIRMLIPLALASWVMGGCAGPAGSAEFLVAEGDYARAFDAARDVLIDHGFTLERIDAQAGVITTRAKPTSGLATPWDGEQSTPGQEVEEFLNRTQRRARVTFAPAEQGEHRVAVEVVVERVHRRGWSPAPVSVRQSTFWRDPQRGAPVFASVIEQDARLAARLSNRIAADAAPRGEP